MRFINNPPSELQVGTNDEIVLHCTTNNIAQIQWYFNGRQLSHSTQLTKVHTNGTLVVTRAGLRNAGTYRCEASNDYGRINADVNVRINGKFMCFGVIRMFWFLRRGRKLIVLVFVSAF